jgi:hypothetical protein
MLVHNAGETQWVANASHVDSALAHGVQLMKL